MVQYCMNVPSIECAHVYTSVLYAQIWLLYIPVIISLWTTKLICSHDMSGNPVT